MKKTLPLLLAAVAFAGFAPEAEGATVVVDGSSTITKLSEAVAVAYAAEDGPDVINIMVDSLAMDDTEIVLDKPIVINGDADGNGEKCDILVDVVAIRNNPTVGIDKRCYLEVYSSGDVTISDVKIHPNNDLDIPGTNDRTALIDAIRLNRHADVNSTPTYTLDRVWVSGSDENDNYIPLDTADNLFETSGVKRWSRQSGNSSHGIITIAKDSTMGEGVFHAVLNDCHVGLGFGDALNITSEDATTNVNGGVFGHSGNNGIRVSGDVVTLTGSPTNRMRVVNVPHIGGTDTHGIFNATGTFDVVEWVDFATINTGRNIQLNGGIPMPVRNCRLMGTLTQTPNPVLYLTNNNSAIDMEDSTIRGSASNNNPFEALPANDGYTTFTDVIFVSDNLGQIMYRNSDNIGELALINCAIPVDGETSESLNVTQPIFQDPLLPSPNYTAVGTVAESPDFALTVLDYDWSEAQGAGQVGNGPGNANVYRPTNVAYNNAASDGSDLVGGAGPGLASVDASIWMLME